MSLQCTGLRPINTEISESLPACWGSLGCDSGSSILNFFNNFPKDQQQNNQLCCQRTKIFNYAVKKRYQNSLPVLGWLSILYYKQKRHRHFFVIQGGSQLTRGRGGNRQQCRRHFFVSHVGSQLTF